jgi:hypothetical protein
VLGATGANYFVEANAMSNDPTTNGAIEPLVQPFIDFWGNYIRQANENTRQLVENFDGASDVKTWQRQWSEAVSKSMDAYLRSPMFLQAMKQNTDLMIKAKQQADDLATEVARNANIPTAGDISGLFERLHTVEEAILQRMDRIDERLKAIEVQTGATQGAGI